MFDKFGKMSYDELIRTAKAEKEEGDEEALIALAQENGLDQEDAEDYMDDLTEVLSYYEEGDSVTVNLLTRTSDGYQAFDTTVKLGGK